MHLLSRVAVNICYEGAFGEEIIRQLPQATLLANVSNVAWFGDSLASAQHLQISRMRAIETGRTMLRATNTGVTAIVDPRGRVAARLPQFTEGVLEGTVQGCTGATPYARNGNVPVLVLAALLVLAVPIFALRRAPIGFARLGCAASGTPALTAIGLEAAWILTLGAFSSRVLVLTLPCESPLHSPHQSPIGIKAGADALAFAPGSHRAPEKHWYQADIHGVDSKFMVTDGLAPTSVWLMAWA